MSRTARTDELTSMLNRRAGKEKLIELIDMAKDKEKIITVVLCDVDVYKRQGLGMGAVAITQKMVSTTDISVSFLKPMNGKRYIIRAEYTQIGRRMARSVGKAIDAETGVVCATSMASFVLTESRAKGLQV